MRIALRECETFFFGAASRMPSQTVAGAGAGPAPMPAPAPASSGMCDPPPPNQRAI